MWVRSHLREVHLLITNWLDRLELPLYKCHMCAGETVPSILFM